MIPLEDDQQLEPYSVYVERFGIRADDVYTRDKNEVAGREFCGRCEGTGNELYSMYKECEDCEGRGYRR